MRRIILDCSAIILLISTAAFAQVDSPQSIKSVAQILGHPIHSMLVAFPIALFILSFVFDLIYFLRKDLFWQKGAYYLIVFGIIGGLIAAIPGFIDFFFALPASGDVHEVGEVHWLLMIAVVALFIVNFAVRWKRNIATSALTTVLSVVGIGIMLVGAWYGGHLVYGHGVGVEIESHERNNMEHTNHEDMEHSH